MPKTISECTCWNPEIDDGYDESGEHWEFCNKCGENYSRDCTPRDDALESIRAVRDFWGQPELNDEVALSLLNRAIRAIEQSE